MRTLYDGQIYSSQCVGGIIRYFNSLISCLPKSFYPYLTSSQENEVTYPEHPNFKLFYYKRFALKPGRLSYWLEKYYFRAVSNVVKPDIIHPTYYSSLTRHPLNQYRAPVVLTVWDMIHELFPQSLDPTGQEVQIKRQAILAAQAIICISENTKKDLLGRYNLPDKNIQVIHLASSINDSFAKGKEAVPNSPYYLYVGSRDNYKNFISLLTAFNHVKSKLPDVKLCVTGSPFTISEQQRIGDLGLTERIQNYGLVSDRHLAKLYHHSLALVYPSLYEGFGIPLLEAMSCGTPVVASNCSSIPEVVGDAGILFDPHSIDDLADILLFLYNHPAERDRLISRGYEQAKKFSWQKTTDQTVEVYRSLI
ncbi:glycosyltransferase family 1 protein [Kamptonema cortianum]|uniref:Glycosyltransferase family 1 protein n=1 Tax=Geitlerinema calcuttense NRMC-F 0142 TaxID=2922238 RepID=A0ABT7LY79_9CYAN|nr:glycosyltransferase family 1 protein [Geitlerinema calcuttense]MDK3157468.1 glycosyltransferase family 1 protein [Kamptonema cortianum]MDL5056967.1 glycosyltransferase family 1 protein [Geitlerinema calcuttense NRMC-F 0142]